MRRWGCWGLTLGGLTGLLLAIVFWLWVRQMVVSPTVPPAIVESPDVVLFLSENSLSYFAAETLQDDIWVDMDPNGQMRITTRAPWGRLRPVVELGLTLQLENQTAVSRLHWARVGFLKVPASWLPQSLIEMAALPGETITRQVPRGFTLTGLQTTPDGIEFYLNWTGP